MFELNIILSISVNIYICISKYVSVVVDFQILSQLSSDFLLLTEIFHFRQLIQACIYIKIPGCYCRSTFKFYCGVVLVVFMIVVGVAMVCKMNRIGSSIMLLYMVRDGFNISILSDYYFRRII